MDIRRIVGQNVAAFRRAKKISQEELGFATELHRTYISGVERGLRNPTVVVLEKLALALGVSMAELVTSRKDTK